MRVERTHARIDARIASFNMDFETIKMAKLAALFLPRADVKKVGRGGKRRIAKHI